MISIEDTPNRSQVDRCVKDGSEAGITIDGEDAGRPEGHPANKQLLTDSRSAFAPSGRGGQTTAALAGFLVALVSAGLFEDTGLLYLPFQTADRTIERFTLANINADHIPINSFR